MVGLDFFREKVDGFISGKVVKHVVEHATDVVFAIVYDPLCFRVPEDRHSHAGLITRIGRFVGFTQKLEAVDRIGGFKRRAGRDLAGRIAKRPAQVVSNRINHCDADCVFKPFKFPNNNRPASPGAG